MKNKNKMYLHNFLNKANGQSHRKKSMVTSILKQRKYHAYWYFVYFLFLNYSEMQIKIKKIKITYKKYKRKENH
jgi:hypothetical protein